MLFRSLRVGRRGIVSFPNFCCLPIRLQMAFSARELPQITAVQPEGTYLVWLDFRVLGMDPKALHKFLVHEAGVGLSAGYLFGPGGEGFARLNIGCARSVLEEGLQRIKTAVKGLD